MPCAMTIVLGANSAYHWQAWYAVLTTMAQAPAGIRFAIVTDQPERYRWFADHLDVVAVDQATVADWAGPHAFRWRFKPMAIRMVAARQPGALLYFDSDVQCRREVGDLFAALNAGECFMHVREHVLSRNRRRGNRRLWEKVGGRSFAGMPVTESSAMWNAGVIAVGADRLGLIDRALEICDAMCADGALDNLSEQLAFSLALESTGALRPADAWFDHYWGNKPGFQGLILERLAEIQQRGFDPPAAAAWLRDRLIQAPLQVRRRWWNRLAARFAQGSPV